MRPLEATGRLVASIVPDGELVVLEGSRHGLYAADHDRVNREILDFARE